MFWQRRSTCCSWCSDGEEHNQWYLLHGDNSFYPKLSRKWKISIQPLVPRMFSYTLTMPVPTNKGSNSIPWWRTNPTNYPTLPTIQTSPRVTSGQALRELSRRQEPQQSCKYRSEKYPPKWLPQSLHKLAEMIAVMHTVQGRILWRHRLVSWRYVQVYLCYQLLITLSWTSLVHDIIKGKVKKKKKVVLKELCSVIGSFSVTQWWWWWWWWWWWFLSCAFSPTEHIAHYTRSENVAMACSMGWRMLLSCLWLGLLQTWGADYLGHVSGWSHTGACCWGPLRDTHHPFYSGVFRPSSEILYLPCSCDGSVSEILTNFSVQVCLVPICDTCYLFLSGVLRLCPRYWLSLLFRYVEAVSEVTRYPFHSGVPCLRYLLSLSFRCVEALSGILSLPFNCVDAVLVIFTVPSI